MKKVQFDIKNHKNLSPTKIIAISFISIILIGSILLAMPFSSANGQFTNYLDALFTATSATCVTGLVVLDTATHWSIIGQLIILTLIQIGGLGLITFTTFFSVLFGKKLGIKDMLLAQETINHFSFQDAIKLIQRVVYVVFMIELLGAALLSIVFVDEFGLKGIYYGVFHSISAFCNAGFDLMGGFKSFTDYNNNPIIVYTICTLIIIGGLGFIVWKDLFEYRKNKKLLLHTKIVLIISSVLLSVGFLFFLAFESNNPSTLGSISLFEKINAALFLSVNTRTAGFATLDLNQLQDVSKIFSIFLMFIGGASGSTAGGIKVTTLGVVLIAVFSQIKGNREAIIFKTRITFDVILKALSILVLGVFLVFTVTTLLLAFQDSLFINTLFEATSAFGTVGLSTGMTTTLPIASRILIIITMFCGRIGPLTFAISLSLRNHKGSDDVIYPDGKIVVG